MRLGGGRYDLSGEEWALIRRVSGTNQVDNYRFEQQELRTRAWLEGLGATVRLFDENVDGGGKSGRVLKDRPVARAALDGVEAGGLRGIAGLDFARLSRDEYGIDAGTMFERVANAKALIAAEQRIYDPRDPRDLDDLRRLAAEAGKHMLTIRDQFWDGIFGKAATEPYFQGLAPFGYDVRYDVIPDPRGRRSTPKLKPVPIKNPEHAEAMADLVEWLEQCPTKGAVLKRWNPKWGHLAVAHAPKQPRTKYGAGWAPSKLTDMLTGPVSGVYTGRFQAGRRAFGRKAVNQRKKLKKSESPIWDGRSDRLEDFFHIADGETPCPCGNDHSALGDLSYWTPAQQAAWAAKFDGGTRSRETKHEHLLKGLLACAHCHQPLVGGGRNGYVCPQRQHRTCKGQCISEGAAWRMLREILPELLTDVERYADRAAEQEASGETEGTLRELLSQRAHAAATVAFLTKKYFGPGVDPRTVPDAAGPQTRRAEDEVKELDARIAAERGKLAGERRSAEIAGQIRNRSLEGVDALIRNDPEGAAGLFRLLVRGVEIIGEGSGNGRTWRLRDYVSLAAGDAGISGGIASSALAYIATALGAAA